MPISPERREALKAAFQLIRDEVNELPEPIDCGVNVEEALCYLSLTLLGNMQWSEAA